MSHLLKIDHLYKKFDSSEILHDINLKIDKGEVLVIVGPSGCGKSTLLRCINGLEEIQGGDIVFEGKKINGKNTKWNLVRQQIGMVFQSYDLFPHMNILDNILLGPLKVQKVKRKDAEEKALALLKRVGLEEKKEAYPRQLSGGQKQRVAIVRALCMNPKIMLFDEVTASLDPEVAREVLDCLLELANMGMTMIIVTHEMAFAKAVADRVLFMDEGKIVEENLPKLFFDNPKSERAKRFLSRFNFDNSLKGEKNG
ncbi:MAG: amino acid ABC transporter ATP-binding protein [Campylobacteraceae bacterium]|nr:amino acid ABC transporter ATP-binding protein [Campylobacteraceae bacterium]